MLPMNRRAADGVLESGGETFSRSDADGPLKATDEPGKEQG